MNNKNAFHPLEIEIDVPDNKVTSSTLYNKDTSPNEVNDTPLTNHINITTLNSINNKNKKNAISSNRLKKKHGNLYLFCYNKRNKPLIVIGPHWNYFIIGFTTILLCDCMLYFFFWGKTNIFLYIGGICLNVVHLLLFLLAFLLNPGLNMNLPRNPNLDLPTCKNCGCLILKGKKQKHCEICEACFIGHDHHCPWTSKCVGQENKRIFCSFLFTSIISFLYPVIVISTYKYE